MTAESKSRTCSRIVPTIWIVAAITALFSAQALWKGTNDPHDIKPLAKELSSIFVIQKLPTVNHVGNLVGVIHTTKQGIGVFLSNADTKAEYKLCEVKDSDYMASSAWV